MARKKRRTKRGKRGKLPKGFPKAAGSRAKKREKVKILTIKSGDVWKAQDALRRDKYFARAVGPNKIATNAPISKM